MAWRMLISKRWLIFIKTKHLSYNYGRPSGASLWFLNINHDTKRVEDFLIIIKLFRARQRITNDFINGGFMVLKPEALDLIAENTMIESIFPMLAEKGELSVYVHNGKWKCMDTHKEVEEMNEHWEKDPFWKIWDAKRPN